MKGRIIIWWGTNYYTVGNKKKSLGTDNLLELIFWNKMNINEISMEQNKYTGTKKLWG
jgi:hypothetical protein